MRMGDFPCLLLLTLLLCGLSPAILGHVPVDLDDTHDSHSQDMSPPEPETNLTFDEIFSQLNANATSEGSISDPMMNPDGSMMAELDMRLTPEQYREFYGTGNELQKRKATRPLRYRWTNAVVPYEFYPNHFTSQQMYTIKQAMREWEAQTCLKFRPATSYDRNRIRFQNGVGCNAALGMNGGTQAVTLQSPNCRMKSIYLHEIGHALGLVHEHQLPDRDKYITINYYNVNPAWRIWFQKYSTNSVNQYGVPFDYYSIMHYGPRSFSGNGGITIQTKDPKMMAVIGKAYTKGLAFSDIKVVNLMYGCNKRCKTTTKCKYPGYLDKNCRCLCPRGVDCTLTGGGGGGGGGKKEVCSNIGGDNKCKYWKGIGYCTSSTYQPWMVKNCAKVCNACEVCSNIGGDNKCKYWKGIGYCTSNTYRPWMVKNCAKVCNACSHNEVAPVGPSKPTLPKIIKTIPETTTPSITSDGDTSREVPSTSTRPVTSTNDPSPPPPTPSKTGTSTYMPSPPPSSVPTTPGVPTTTYMPSPPPTTTATPKNCININGDYNCNYWSRTGYCTSNKSWMVKNCAKACNVCRVKEVCSNIHGDNMCKHWSGMGYCSSSTYRTWMVKNCAKVCNACGEDEGTTTVPPPKPTLPKIIKTITESTTPSITSDGDTSTEVPSTSTRPVTSTSAPSPPPPTPSETGTSTSMPSPPPSSVPTTPGVPTTTFMPPPPPTTTATPTACINSYGDYNCNYWSRTGYCNSNKSWMVKNCAKACNVCRVKECKDENVHCPYWSRVGYCTTDLYTSRHCQKSCGACD